MRGHQPTLDYVLRRTAEGKSKPEIVRCLKRHVVREIFLATSAGGSAHRKRPLQPLDRYRSFNALAETINGLFNTEVIRRRGPWRSLEAVEYATLKWVDWHSTRRLLEPIGNMPPAEAEARYYAQLEPAAMAA